MRKQLQDKQFADLYFMLVLCFCDVVRIGPQITEQERREKQEILLSFVLNMRKVSISIIPGTFLLILECRIFVLYRISVKY